MTVFKRKSENFRRFYPGQTTKYVVLRWCLWGAHTVIMGDGGGLVVEPRTPELEVGVRRVVS